MILKGMPALLIWQMPPQAKLWVDAPEMLARERAFLKILFYVCLVTATFVLKMLARERASLKILSAESGCESCS